MEIRKVKEEEKESLSKYLVKMQTVSYKLNYLGLIRFDKERIGASDFNDLCFALHDGKKYLLTHFTDLIGIVENDKGTHNPYYLGVNGGFLEYFGNESVLYQINIGEFREITKTSIENKNMNKLSYLTPIDNYPRYIIEYIQYVDEISSTLELSYDVTERKNLDSALAYTFYHCPDKLILTVLKWLFLFSYKREYAYCLGIDDNRYYQPLISTKNFYIGSRQTSYDAKPFLEEICSKGFNKDIPSDLLSLIKETNETYNTLKLVSNEYKNYIKGH